MNIRQELERALNAAGQNVWNSDAQPGEDGVYDSTYETDDKENK